METAERDAHAASAIPVRDLVGATSRRDIDLDHDEVRLVIERDLLDVLVPDRDVSVIGEVTGERCEPKRRKQRVLDRPEEGAGRLG